MGKSRIFTTVVFRGITAQKLSIMACSCLSSLPQSVTTITFPVLGTVDTTGVTGTCLEGAGGSPGASAMPCSAFHLNPYGFSGLCLGKVLNSDNYRLINSFMY